MISSTRTIGWFGSDIWDAAEDVVKKALAVVEDVPGLNELREAAKDFANTAVGKTVLRAMATSFYGGLAWTLGPQLASVTFALPGLFRGEPFEKAWFDEVKWRTEKTAEILGADVGALIGRQISETLLKLGKDVGVGRLIDDGVQELARRYNIREDVAAMVKSLWNKIDLPRSARFDPVTGRALAFVEQDAFAFRPGGVETTFYTADFPPWLARDAANAFTPGEVETSFYSKALPPQPSPARQPQQIPVRSSELSSSAKSNRLAGDVVLGLVIVAAAGALYSWYRYESGKPIF